MTLTEIVNQLRSCNYECEAGKLENNLAWIELVKMAKPVMDESPLKNIALAYECKKRLVELEQSVWII